MKGLLPWALAALVLALLVVFVGDCAPARDALPTAVSRGTDADSSASLAALAEGEPGQATPDTTVGSDLRSAVSQAQLVPAAAVSSLAGFWIEVVYAEDGAPAAGAEVDVRFDLQGDLEREARGWGAARSAGLRAPPAPTGMVLPWHDDELGATLVADDAGRVRLLQFGSYGELRASARRGGNLYRGELLLTYELLAGVDSVLRVELQPAFAADVLVLDAAGVPVPGVAVVALVPETSKDARALATLGYSMSTEERGIHTILAGGVTDGEGRAELLDPSNRVARAMAAGKAPAVQAMVLVDTPVRAPLVAGQTAELRLPPMGSVAVELAPGDHAQVHDFAAVSLSVQGVSNPPIATLRRNMDGGRTRFAHVGLGLQLSAKISVFNDYGPFVFAGPTKPGQEVRFVMPEALGQRVLAFELVDEAGAPIADTWVRVVQRHGRGAFGVTQLTDGSGRLRVECGNPMSTATALEIVAPGQEREGLLVRSLEAKVDLGPEGPFPMDAAFHDAGVLVLRQLPLLAVGRVVDGSGAAIPGATVEVTAGADQPTLSMIQRFQRAVTQSNGRGEFLLEGTSPGPDAKLFASAKGFGFAEPQPLVVGARDVVLVLGSTGAVRLALVLPEGLRPDSARAELLRGRDGPLDLVEPRRHGPYSGRVELQRDKLEPGPWTLYVISAADEVPIVRMEIDVPVAGLVDLGEIDLTEQLLTLELRAVTRDGLPVRSVSARRVDGDRSVALVPGFHPPAIVPKPPDGAVVEVSAMGYLPVRATVSGPVLEVVLEKSNPARLVLPPGLRVPSKRLPVSFAFERLSGDDTQRTFPLVSLENQSEYPTNLGPPGRFRLSVLDFSKRNRVLNDARVESGEFEVRAIDLEQNLPIELPIDAGEWLKLLEKHDGP
ncbi:MAG: hypothetical protein GC161_18860 [Planctomycetaceae bacterium]|nr:hypothetical protein [Planctomycetaceae bacterium]